MDKKLEKSDKIIANKYLISELISRGAFGAVFKGENLGNGEFVAIKFENPGEMKSLKHETKILNYLYSNKVRQIPAIYWYGLYGNLPCLVITYYERSLESYIASIHNHNSSHNNSILDEKNQKNIDKILASMIQILSSLHKYFVLHRDLKPQNFMIKNDKLYLIDFGLATFYIGEDGLHCPNTECCTIIGTPKFISINILKGHRFSRRDDIISIAYIYIYMCLGYCPWTNPPSESSMFIKEENSYVEHDILNIEHPINKIRLTNKQIEIFKKDPHMNKLEKAIIFLEQVYSYEYEDTPNYEKYIEYFLR
jgi:serine/threonine protein kinase